MIRYPIAPIVRRLRVSLGEVGNVHRCDFHPNAGDGELHGYDAIAIALGVSRATARRMVAFGLTERQADHAAIALGMHPALLWPSWWTDGPSEEEAPGWFGDDPPMDELDLEAAS